MFMDELEKIALLLRKATGALVLVGADPGEPVPSSDGPVIVLTPGESGVSFADTDEADEIPVNVDFFLADDSCEETEEGIRIRTGLRKLDAMAETIRDTLRSALEDFHVAQGTYYTDLSQYPVFIGGMTIVYRNDGFTNF